MSAHGARSLFTATVLALQVAACSGADSKEVFGPSSPENDTSASNPAPNASADSPSPADPAPSASAPETPGTPSTSGTSEPTPAPTAAPTAAPTPPAAPASCTQEVEPNNDAAQATPFTSRFCGRIDNGSDADFASFVVPANANAITLTHSEKGGDVTYRYFANGVPILGDDPVLPAIPGTTYTVRTTSTNGGGKHPTYEIDVSFN